MSEPTPVSFIVDHWFVIAFVAVIVVLAIRNERQP